MHNGRMGVSMTIVEGKGEEMKEDIEKAKLSAVCPYPECHPKICEHAILEIAQAFASARAEERERCARIVESEPLHIWDGKAMDVGKLIAEKIRKGG